MGRALAFFSGPQANAALAWLLVPALALVVAHLQLRLWQDGGSIDEIRQLRAKIETQRQKNEQSQLRNQALEAEVLDLKQGLEAIEERARSELGMVKPGEVFYQIVE